LTARKVITLHP